MTAARDNFFSLPNLYVAYRKAKAEAFYENTHSYARNFTEYEQTLDRNLRKLQARLSSKGADWQLDPAFIGDHAYVPKSVDLDAWDNHEAVGHFRAINPRQDWLLRFEAAGARAPASLRLVIRPSVDFQIVSALWIVLVGELFDATLDKSTSFGNRLRRSFAISSDRHPTVPNINLVTPNLFAPYFSAYRQWRERGLASMERALKRGDEVLAITMDIEQFYHRVAPRFLTRRAFLETVGLTLSPPERRFTTQLLDAIDTWYRTTPDYRRRPIGAIPVGLSASKVIANVLLVQFDRAVVETLNPIYYGRYVDDIFLVLKADGSDGNAESVANRIRRKLAPMVTVRRNDGGLDSLRLHLPYAKDSELIFSGRKQKIFVLSPPHGQDLLQQIREQIRQQSSEHRLLSSVPEDGNKMAARALLASSDAALQADALRKADVVSVRRLGFSLLLSDVETYADDLQPNSWKATRYQFYELVERYVLTPAGFFEFAGYIPRVFGLMMTCGDFDNAKNLIKELRAIADLLLTTTTLGRRSNRGNFDLCLEQYAHALLQVGLQAATARSIKLTSDYLRVLSALKGLHQGLRIPSRVDTLRALARQILLADWGRRPYKDFWLGDQKVDEVGPSVPTSFNVRRVLRLGMIRRLKKVITQVRAPHWPALAFPTRPLKIDEIGLVAQAVLSDDRFFRRAIRFFRGAEVSSSDVLGFHAQPDESPFSVFEAAGNSRPRIAIAVTSILTTNAQWEAAVLGKHDRSVKRYEAINGLVNRILSEPERPDYVVMPELSIPLRWALRAARKLAANGVSLIAGVEYHKDRTTGDLRNDCLVSLTTQWPGYSTNIVYLQPKFEPAHHERINIKEVSSGRSKLFKPKGIEAKLTVYSHRGFYFSALICSDLTNIAHRRDLRGCVDALFVLEWNRDIHTFASLVESTAVDLHAFVIQVNNRKYGDSRLRAPAQEDFDRDLVQVRGGFADYYVLGEVDYEKLRAEQRRRRKRGAFKPVPIGFVMSRLRK